jgi:hypothetical protein
MKILKYLSIALLTMFLTLYVWGRIYSAVPDIVSQPRLADTVRIGKDLIFLTKSGCNRNYLHMDTLNKVADYIRKSFLGVSERVEEQKYTFKDVEFRNVICSFGPKDGERIIIGAHYDVCRDQEGADDNASGVAGLLELGRLLKDTPLKYRIDLVAYSLEEPPFFRSEYMGSYIHAKYLHDHQIPVKGMISLEMIGYYSEAKYSQHFPLFFFRWFYGNKGNFVMLIQKSHNGAFGKEMKTGMLKAQTLRTKAFSGPAWIPGIDYSDHLNYWKYGYSAMMITNTSFYRNYNYHTKEDKLETLNIGNIGLVVDGLYRAVRDIK